MSLMIAMSVFSLAMSISPGPVNFVTLSTGLNYGFRKAFPFVSGATIGFTLLLAVIGLGVARILADNSELMALLGYIGAGFIIYMGYRIATSGGTIETVDGKPAGFWEGVLLQWLNPKAWAACVAGVSVFNLSDSAESLMLFVLIYFAVCYVSIAAWGYAGSRARKLTSRPKSIKLINVVMGGGLILVAIYLQLMQADTLLHSSGDLEPRLAQTQPIKP